MPNLRYLAIEGVDNMRSTLQASDNIIPMWPKLTHSELREDYVDPNTLVEFLVAQRKTFSYIHVFEVDLKPHDAWTEPVAAIVSTPHLKTLRLSVSHYGRCKEYFPCHGGRTGRHHRQCLSLECNSRNAVGFSLKVISMELSLLHSTFPFVTDLIYINRRLVETGIAGVTLRGTGPLKVEKRVKTWQDSDWDD